MLAVPGQDISRSAFEAIALDAYRERKIATAQLRRLLGFESGYDLDGFLKQHEVWLEYGWEELEKRSGDASAPWPLSRGGRGCLKYFTAALPVLDQAAKRGLIDLARNCQAASDEFPSQSGFA